MKKSSILIVILFVFVILVSGCTSSSQAKTFSDGVISFDYPGGFINHSDENNSKNSGWQILVELENSNLLDLETIMVAKNNASSPTEIITKSILKIKNDSACKILSLSTETNPNGIVMTRINYLQEGAILGKEINYDMFFQVNDTVYGISVSGFESDKQQVLNTTNMVFQSIK